MLNGSLVLYSDSEGSEGQDVDSPKLDKPVATLMKPKKLLSSPPVPEKHNLSKRTSLLVKRCDEVFFDGDESFDEAVSPTLKKAPPTTLPITPICLDISSIPLPGECSSEERPHHRSNKQKSKHATKAFYLPPPLRVSPSSPTLESGARNAKRADDTPKREKSSRTCETVGICTKRKGTHLMECLSSDKGDLLRPKQVKTDQGVFNKRINGVEPRRLSEPKKVTLKPFWQICPPPSKPLTSICVNDVHGSLRREFVSTIPQPSSLPYDINSIPNQSPLISSTTLSGHSSLPDLSGEPTSLETPSPRLCSLSDFSSSSIEASPVSSVSPLNADSSQIDVQSRDSVQRRHSHESNSTSDPRSRLYSLPPRLRRRVFDGPGGSCQNKTSEPVSWSPWKGWTSNFQKKYFGFEDEYIDTHCHLDFLYRREGFRGSFQKYKVVHQDTFPPNFAGCVAVFCEPQSFNPKGGLWKAITLEPDVWVAMGCHPKCAEDYTSRTEEALTACLKFPKVIAAGEFGLDYSGRFKDTADRQKDVFVRQLKIAVSMDMPLVIHCRCAEDDTFEIMEKYVPKHLAVHRHCFSLRFEEARRWIDTFPNLYVGLTPLVTYNTAVETHDLARKVPLDRLLLETDAPYFVPREVPRSEMSFSHPGMAITVAEEVARYRGIPVSKVLQATRKNTKEMYGI